MHKEILYFQTKFLAEKKSDSITVKGFASTGDKDRYNDKVLPTAFNDSLPLFMKNPIMLLQHDDNKVIGKFTETVVKSNGLEVVGDVMYDVDGCMEKVADGTYGAFSIGFITQAYQYEDGQGHVIYKSDEGLMAGYSWDDMYTDEVCRVITKLDLVEISIVSTPANPYALFQVAKKFFDAETKSLKALQMEKKEDVKTEDAPVEPVEIVEDTPEEKNVEVETVETPNENPNPTTEEVPAGETPEIVPEPIAPVDTAVEEGKSEDVKAVENPTKTPTGVTEEKVKDLITESVNLAIKELSRVFEEKLVSLSKEKDELKSALDVQVKNYAKLENEILNIETQRPHSRDTVKSVRPLTDADILASLRRTGAIL